MHPASTCRHAAIATTLIALLTTLSLGCTQDSTPSSQAAPNSVPMGPRDHPITASTTETRPTEAAFQTATQEIMATWITVVLPRGDASKPAAEEVFRIFREVDARASEWKASAPLTRVNRAAGKSAVAVPPDLFRLVQRAIALARRTHGAYDPTWAALWGLWDFNAPEPTVPSRAEAQRRAALVDFKKVLLDPSRHSIALPEAGMALGLGGIAKGWALDLAGARLQALGIRQYYMSAGGQVSVGGLKGDRPWRIGIRDPRGTPDDYFAILEASDTSVATSGDYERFFIQDGIRYHHILDPHTGFPARGLRSATVISPDATQADGLATALMVMGLPDALALVAELKDTEVVLVDDQGRVHLSAGLDTQFRQVHAPRR